MSRYARNKRDANEPEIVEALERAGAKVERLSGEGVPDLLVGYRGTNTLIEVKDGAKVPSAQKLTPAQQEWHRTWRGQVRIANSIAQAFAAVGIEVLKLKSESPKSSSSPRAAPVSSAVRTTDQGTQEQERVSCTRRTEGRSG